MFACPACRHANPPDAEACVQCGASLMGATLLGMSPPPVESAETSARSRTLFGLPAPSRPEPLDAEPTRPDVVALPVEPPAAERSQTLFGVPAPVRSVAPQAVPAAAPAPVQVPAPAPTPAPEDAPTLRRPARAAAPETAPAPAPAPARRPAAAPAPAKRPGSTTLLHQEAAEIMAAAKIAGAVADEERNAAQRRLRKTLWVLLGVALVTAFVGFLSFRDRHRFQAEVGGELRVQRDAEGYAVKVRLRTSAPALVQVPEGATGGPERPVDGESDVVFRLPDHTLKVGDNQLALGVTPSDDPDARRQLSLHVRVYYRFVSTPAAPPEPGKRFELRMALMPGWRLEVADAQVEPLPGGELGVSLDSAPMLAAAERFSGPLGEFPLQLSLTGPGGERATFTEALRFPLPPTRLVVLQPLHWALTAADHVDIEGLSTPGAAVEAGGVTVTADATGRFKLSLPLTAPGRNTLPIEARLPGRTPTRDTLAVERVTPAALSQARAAARRLAGAIQTPAPSYASLLSAPPAAPGAPFRLSGRVLAVRRGETTGVDELQLATCAAGCPYWITAGQPVFATAGQQAVVVGRFTGQHTFQTREGQSVVAPRVEALAVLAGP
jgi:hypothetical protein